MNIKETIQYILGSFKFWFIINPWEEGVRVRFGKYQKKFGAGTYIKIPYFDSVYVEQVRLRIIPMPLQSMTMKNGKTLTARCAIGYKIVDVQKLYNTINQPEITIQNLALDAITKFVSDFDEDIFDIDRLKKTVLEVLHKTEYGIEFQYVKISSICEVRTYRLIQDQHWEHESLTMLPV